MDELLRCEDHLGHDPRWSLASPSHRDPVCIACLLQLLQDSDILMLKKKMILSELLGLLCQQLPDILSMVQGDHPVQSHLVLTLLDLTESEDQTFVSMAMEASLKLILQLKSEDLVQCVLDRITNECTHKDGLLQCLPFLVLLGRLLNDIPGLAERLVHEHESLLRELGNGLLCPSEETVSAVVYVLIFVYDEGLQSHLPPRLCHQVHHSIIIHLTRSHSQELLINLIGLLQRNLISEGLRAALLSLTVEGGSSLLTCLKKLLMSRSDVLQMSAVQSCCLILARGGHCAHGASLLEADLAEVLFEMLNRNDEQQIERLYGCLKMLADVEDFFTRCHTVYGMASVLRSINHVSERKNSTPLREGLQLLTLMLQRQPPSIPLFSNPGDVKSCLVTIATSLEKPDRQVVLLSLQAFKALLSVHHLGTPVPFSEVGKTLELAGARTGEIIRHKRHTPTSRRHVPSKPTADKAKDTSVSILNLLLGCMVQATRVVEHCQGDPVLCEETFRPPQLLTQTSSLSSFILHLLKCCDDYCIPSVMTKWESLSSSEDVLPYFTMLHQLYQVSASDMLPLLSKLISTGCLATALQTKARYRYDGATESAVTEVLVDILTAFPSDQSVDRENLCHIIRRGLSNITCALKDCPSQLQEEDTPLSACFVCLYTIYLSLKHQDSCLSPEDIQSVLISSLHHYPDLAEWPPFSINCFAYVTAWCHRCTEFDISLHCRLGFHCLLDVLSGCALSTWYTDQTVQFAWCFSSPGLAKVCGPQVLEQWLDQCPESLRDGDVSTQGDCPKQTDVLTLQSFQQFQAMMANPNFRAAVQNLLLCCTSEDLTEKLVTCVNIAVAQAAENEDIHTWVAEHIPQTLQAIFLKKYNINYMCVSSLLKILVTTRKSHKFQPSSGDLKIVYHVINQLTKTPPLPQHVQRLCLVYLSSSLQPTSDPTKIDRTVSSLLLQRQDLLSFLQTQVDKGDNSPHYTQTLDILTKLLLATDKTFKQAWTVSVNLEEVIGMLDASNPMDKLPALRLLSALYSKGWQGTVLSVLPSSQGQGLSDRQLRVVWIYCQQALLQECGDLREAAVSCMHHVIQYLMVTNTSLGVKLLQQPWNRPLLKSILDEFDGVCLDSSTAQLLTTPKAGRNAVDDEQLNRIHKYLIRSEDSVHLDPLRALVANHITREDQKEVG